jgi:endoglycosylceramidase
MPFRSRAFLSGLPALALPACAPAPADTAIPAPVPALLDAVGRVALHRGMNVSGDAKYTADHLPALSDTSIQTMLDAGITFARVLTFWDAVEPEEGAYDEAYLAGLDALLGRLDAAGLTVMLDMHQDVWGVGFGGDGAPRWTCDEALYESFEPPSGSWYLAYLSDEVQACFDSFWADPGLQEQFAAAWARLAEIGRRHPSVAGYDLLNEPFWGTSTQEEFEEVLLPAFYERVAAGIRAVDDERCDFGPWRRPCRFLALEPSTQANILPSRLVFPDLDGLVFAPHFYPLYAEEGTGFDGDLTHEIEHLEEIIAHGQDQGVPVLLGEFGIFSTHGTEEAYVRGLLDTFESHAAGTAYWSWDPHDTYGVLTPEDEPGYLLPAWYRPYFSALPAANLAIEPLADGMRARFTATAGDRVVAMVPAACAATTTVEGAEVEARDGLRWTLAPQGSGTVEVTVQGCSEGP